MKPSIAVIGSGFGGLAAVIELKKQGFDDIVVFEKGSDVGGVWRENTYPGAACDIPSPFYSFSFEPNPRWPHRFSRQPAILDYMRQVADKYDVRRHIRFGVEVIGAAFDERTGRWTVRLSTGDSVVVDVLVSAVGQLARPVLPEIAGRERFAGVSFHSAKWRHDIDLTGKRVAVIGTGASAIQFVPEIQQRVGRLTVFQRSAPYIVPRPDREFSPIHHTVFEKAPVTELGERVTWYGVVEGLSFAWVYSKPLAAAIRAVSKWHMRRQTKAKPGLFEKVWPDYPVGCKRILFSDDYLPALVEPNVELCTERISEITESGVRTAAGTEHEADVIIWGTGFAATEFLAPMTITGEEGRDLHEEWKGGARAYYGMTVPGFPNLFIMYGPNTNTGGGSIIYFLEAQAKYLGRYVAHMVGVGAPLNVRPDVEQAFDERIQAKLNGSVWSRCSSWYRQADGRITTNWPSLGIEYKAQAKFDPADYEVVS
ncbi:NAD(P)/FAD-dependent oxidoreductase [Nocardia cyriacigeorgica]|uniref:NAD(P)/FAD-dependent oxidoreductase n=1 Tax=Nocardia cyriacigeorgica TaxID=135487 RepID=A0A6P1DAQ1_9NOCA|nr:NAD(P)/FAD-dependent oxidoreductase [Nocardia cyriacigeorgica]NEW38125.1 NAD(P)/FAD-dependent oxidoreductase [Nocardia cyriacigeorgica]NEW45783.1 NAD(P)/FAD-dependent oxidoreductase [Nocardia cyriacigeorgica]NEW48492.1 NAD(P)/FAD-dependent oxidoreductase [Nocardia cyriacigeorgica]NEW57520.1 NAD(P)/FAD-dependent oxidoreductase [Nocardia cyriacigeorgica]